MAITRYTQKVLLKSNPSSGDWMPDSGLSLSIKTEADALVCNSTETTTGVYAFNWVAFAEWGYYYIGSTKQTQWGKIWLGEVVGDKNVEGGFQISGTLLVSTSISGSAISGSDIMVDSISGSTISGDNVIVGSVTAQNLQTNLMNYTTQTLTDGATIATNAALGNFFTVTLGGNRQLGNPTNPIGGQKIVWAIRQDGAGNRTLTFDSAFRFGTSIASFTCSTEASKTDYLGAVYNVTDSKWDIIATVNGY